MSKIIRVKYSITLQEVIASQSLAWIRKGFNLSVGVNLCFQNHSYCEICPWHLEWLWMCFVSSSDLSRKKWPRAFWCPVFLGKSIIFKSCVLRKLVLRLLAHLHSLIRNIVWYMDCCLPSDVSCLLRLDCMDVCLLDSQVFFRHGWF